MLHSKDAHSRGYSPSSINIPYLYHNYYNYHLDLRFFFLFLSFLVMRVATF